MLPENVPAPAYMAPTAWPAIRFWKPWYLHTGHIKIQSQTLIMAKYLIKDGDLDGAIPAWKTDGTNAPKEMILITQSVKELKLLMSDYVGIVRNNERLQRAMKRLDLLFTETEALYQKTIVSPQLCELRNMITVAYLIVKSAEFRQESRGLHFNTDYPDKLERIQNIVL